MLEQTTEIHRLHIVSTLTKLRQEWQEAAAGTSLMAINGCVGLILTDVAMAIGLTTVECVQVLGADLAHEIDAVLAMPTLGGNGRH